MLEEENFVDLGETGGTLGDMFVFNSTLRRDGHKVGHTGVVCTITSATEAQCVGTAWFHHKGQITIQGLTSEDAEHFWFPITGGSEDFVGAEGVLEVKDLGGGRERLIFHLED